MISEESILAVIRKNYLSVKTSEAPASHSHLYFEYENIFEFLSFLKENEELSYNMLIDMVATDYPEEDKIEITYQLYSTSNNHLLQLSSKIPRSEPLISTASKIWAIAQFQEREIYDLFGVKFEGHPDLRRLFLEDDWKGFPLLKDYKDDFMLKDPTEIAD